MTALTNKGIFASDAPFAEGSCPRCGLLDRPGRICRLCETEVNSGSLYMRDDAEFCVMVAVLLKCVFNRDEHLRAGDRTLRADPVMRSSPIRVATGVGYDYGQYRGGIRFGRR